jgi:hypothetical protein
MTKFVELDRPRPNNWFLDKRKLNTVRAVWHEKKQHLLPAVSIITIDNDLSLIDGHCRAYVAWEYGAKEILAEILESEQIRGNIRLLTIFHQQGPVIGIKSIGDLGKRIIDATDNTADRVHISLKIGWRPKSLRI